jgi:similar to spore coat protein
MNDQLIACDMLSGVKANIKCMAAALTETATPDVHQTLERHLQKALQFHQQLTQFMMQKGWYQPYDVDQMIQADFQQSEQLQQSLNQTQYYGR